MSKVLVSKEAELGEYGKASVELTSEAKVILSVKAEVDLLGELEKLAAKTETKLDDTVVAYIKQLIEAANQVAA